VVATIPQGGFSRLRALSPKPESSMEKDAKEALQVTKEIVVKFIEAGRISPANFAEVFPGVYQVVLQTITRPGGPAVSGGVKSGENGQGA
jgi:hypothetical protein